MTSPEIDPGVHPGDVLAGKYRVERVLGAGGMGVVVAAHHIQLDEKVALKFLHPDAVGNAEALARFEREARAAVKIKSEHVARVLDVAQLENGAPYMVMEYLEGGDLSGVLQKQGRLPVAQAVDFVLQACEAIAEAHSLGIVHRDLKPSNLFCIRRRDGQLSIKVLDFGISKLTGVDGAASGSRNMSMTKTTSVVGSPVYMSPEQMQSSKGVDARTDIWSLGIILYELLTGRVPFDADTVTELAIRVATEPTPPLSGMTPPLPPGIEQAIVRCLEKSRERRFQNVAELAAALVEFGSPRARASLERIGGMLGLAETVLLAPQAAPSPPSTAVTRSRGTMAAWQTTGGEAQRPGGKRVVVVVAALLGIAMLAGGAVLLRTRKSAPAEAPSAAAIVTGTAPAQPSSPPSVVVPGSSTPTAADVTPSQPDAGAAPTSAPHVAPRATGPARAATPAAAAPPAAKAHCNPPYYLDDQGNRVFKKECL
jgi:serine/threonine-protein kinase